MLLLISASPITKRTFPHLQTECKQLSPTYEYSPEHAASVLSEGERPLLETTNESDTFEFITSPPFIRVPLEDRSKYEKLTGSLDDLSSDSDPQKSDTENFGKSDRERGAVVRKRKIKNIPEKIHAAVISKVDIPLVKTLSERVGHHRSKTHHKTSHSDSQSNNRKGSASVGYDSDDSIGSASDLRANEDVLENEDEQNRKCADEISETISESIRTCGSSAYHAECESMATKEDDAISRAIRMKRVIQHHNSGLGAFTVQPEEDDQKPANEDLLFVGHQYGEKPLLLDDELDSDCELKLDNSKWSIEKKVQSAKDIWIEPNCFEETSDVFANAPFPNIKSKKKLHQTSSPLSELKEESGRNTSENLFEAFEESPKTSENQSPLLLLSPPTVQPPNTLDLEIENYPQIQHEQNLLLSSPSSTSFSSLNPFSPSNVIQSTSSYGIVTVNSNIININVPNVSPFDSNDFETNFPAYIPTPTTETTSFPVNNVNFSTPANNFYCQPFQPVYCDSNVCDNGLGIYENITFPNTGTNNSDFAFIRSSSNETLQQLQFGSIPQAVEFETSDVLENDSAYYFHEEDGKKDRKGKSKYQLIDTDANDRHVEESAAKNLYKSGKSSKKINSKSKKNVSKPSKSQVAFSNMSFEDFPSDDSEQQQISNMSTPFEVVRKSYEEDKKFGSLKRRSNPFT